MNNIYSKIFSSGAVKSVDIIVVFALTKILTQHLDQQSYSLYVIIENILLIVNVVLLLGYDRYLIRETSLLSKWDKVIANKYQKARINIFDLGLKIVPLVLLIICTLLWNNNLPILILYTAILTVAIFSRAFTAINVAKLLGRNHIWQGNLLKETMAKAVLFFIVLILGFNYDLSLWLVLIIYAVSRIFSFYVSACYVSLYWPKENFQSVMQDFKLNRFDYSNVQLSFFRIQILNYCFKYSGAIVLLIVGKSILSGHFDVIQKLSLAITTIQFLAVAALTPYFGRLYAEGNLGELRLFSRKFSLVLFSYGAIIFSIYFIWGRDILEFFNLSESYGMPTLLIISLGALVELFFGPTGVVMIVAGNENTLARMITKTFLFFLPFSLIGSYYFGLYGLSVSITLSGLFLNLTKWRFVNKNIYEKI